MIRQRFWPVGFVVVVSMLAFLAGCVSSGGSGGSREEGPGPTVAPPPQEPEESDDPVEPVPPTGSDSPAREHDVRLSSDYYTLDAAGLTFDALPGLEDTDRWWGTLDETGYRVEVPQTWNGMLVLYAHGYRGLGPVLTVDNPEIREYLLQQGYAWAASSYRANHYDVRSGIEDTNALAAAFVEIAADNGRTLANPGKTYVIGQSMGGHIAGALVEAETLANVVNRYQYDGALSLCGVMGDTELLDYFAAYNLAAMELAGVGADVFPVSDADQRRQTFLDVLWTDYEQSTADLTAQGERLKAILINLSGGERPVISDAYAAASAREELDRLHGYAGMDGTIDGVLAGNVVDTWDIDYRFDTALDAVRSPAEQAFNDAVFRVMPDADANPVQPDGLRWVPRLNGALTAPVITLHTLGDLWVPFSMQQVYARRAIDNGRQDLLVQRAIRATDHCDFTPEEQIRAFADLVNWDQVGVKPEGDDVLTAAAVADPDYGCLFTEGEALASFPCGE